MASLDFSKIGKIYLVYGKNFAKKAFFQILVLNPVSKARLDFQKIKPGLSMV